MSGDRTVKVFARDIDHLTGVKIEVKWIPLFGLYLRDSETGSTYALGGSIWTVLSPDEQQSICRALHRVEWMTLLGLDGPDDDD